MFHFLLQEIDFAGAAGSGKNVEVRDQNLLTATDVEQPLPGVAEIRLRKAEDGGVLSGVEIGHGHGKVRSDDFFAAGFFPSSWRSLIYEFRIDCVMFETASHQDLPLTSSA